MYEAQEIIGTCINCIVPGNLLATLMVLVVGIGIAVQSERRKASNIQAVPLRFNQ
jgi:hypothetical protein